MQINGRKNTLPHAQTHFKIKSLGCCDLSDYLLFRLLSRARISLYHHFEFCQSSPLQCVCMYVCWGIGGGGVSPITVLWWQSVKLSQPYDRGCEGLKKKTLLSDNAGDSTGRTHHSLRWVKGRKKKNKIAIKYDDIFIYRVNYWKLNMQEDFHLVILMRWDELAIWKLISVWHRCQHSPDSVCQALVCVSILTCVYVNICITSFMV